MCVSIDAVIEGKIHLKKIVNAQKYEILPSF
jgi:hypothetical protein